MKRYGKPLSSKQLLRRAEEAEQHAAQLSQCLTALVHREMERTGRVILTHDELRAASAKYRGVTGDPCDRGMHLDLVPRAQKDEPAPVQSEEKSRIIH